MRLPKMDFLDKNISNELRSVVNSSRIFYRDSQEKKNYNLICAVMDRIDDGIEFLNQYNYSSHNMNDILLFMVHACIVIDAVKETMKQLKIKGGEEYKKYFKDICANEPLCLTEDNSPTDIKFFEYLRALIFAHPFETSRAKFLKEKEIHYSPYLLSELNNFKKDCIGIVVYSNQDIKTKTLYIPYETLKAFIKSRYEMLVLVKNELEKRIENKKKEWKRKKIDRKQSNIQVLQEIHTTLNERFCDTYDIECLIDFLEYESTNPKNMNSVQQIKNIIISQIPQMCDSVDNLDYDKLVNITDEIIYGHPKKTYKTFIYDSGKIFSYLNESINNIDQMWGRSCAKNFSKQFAKKWVDIDAENMKYDEIKLLTMTACYLELQAEKENDVEQN